MAENICVDLNDLISTLEMHSMTDDFSRSFVNKQSGRIVCLFEEEDFSDVEDEDLEGDLIPEHYAPIPDKEELNEYQMMERFCDLVTNEKIQDDLFVAIQGKGAFGRFNTAIRCHNIKDQWYKFRDSCIREIAVEFCKQHGLDYR